MTKTTTAIVTALAAAVVDECRFDAGSQMSEGTLAWFADRGTEDAACGDWIDATELGMRVRLYFGETAAAAFLAALA